MVDIANDDERTAEMDGVLHATALSLEAGAAERTT
jgi:hypothetical protein